MFNIEKFGKKIAQLRKAADMTQYELAESLNLTRQAISKYERGESFPDVSILVTMAQVLGTTPGELISAGEATTGETRLLEEVATTQDTNIRPTADDLLGVAPLLRPSTLEKLSQRLSDEGVDISHLMSLSEYLSDEATLALLEKQDDSILTPELLEKITPFLTDATRYDILQKIFESKLDWHLLPALYIDRSIIEAAVVEGILPWEALTVRANRNWQWVHI